MRYSIGIDAGSTFCKTILLDGGGLLQKNIRPTGWQPPETALAAARELAAAQGAVLEECAVTCTGYGRESIAFAQSSFTEITCHARGAVWLSGQISGVVDIGGQDSKVIRLRGDKAADFQMNDKCAAGTGRFLEMACRVLEVPIERLDEVCDIYDAASINSMCAVFAESEIIGLIAARTERQRILGGVVVSIAARIAQMLAKLRFSPGDSLLMTGGLARSACVVETIERASGCRLHSHPDSVFAGAIGAALYSCGGAA